VTIATSGSIFALGWISSKRLACHAPSSVFERNNAEAVALRDWLSDRKT